MRHEVVMPHLSDEVEEGILVTWFVEPGAGVKQGDLIAEVQVQKVSQELYAPADGRVERLPFAPGDAVSQGAVIAVIDDEKEAPGEAAGMPEAAAEAAAPGETLADQGVPLVEPLTAMRRAIAERLQIWLASTAQLTLTAEADVTALSEGLIRTATSGRRVPYTEAVVRACALALRNHPRMGARLTDQGLVYPEAIDIGVAVALEDGLIVPVVRGADDKDVEALGREIADLADRARTSRLVPADTEGGVFSVTNLGAYGIDAFTPLLNPPQTAILGVGRAQPRPAVVEGTIAVRTLMVLSLTFDHRVVDGAPAASFLADVVRLLENPGRLLAAVETG